MGAVRELESLEWAEPLMSPGNGQTTAACEANYMRTVECLLVTSPFKMELCCEREPYIKLITCTEEFYFGMKVFQKFLEEESELGFGQRIGVSNTFYQIWQTRLCEGKEYSRERLQ